MIAVFALWLFSVSGVSKFHLQAAHGAMGACSSYAAIILLSFGILALLLVGRRMRSAVLFRTVYGHVKWIDSVLDPHSLSLGRYV